MPTLYESIGALAAAATVIGATGGLMALFTRLLVRSALAEFRVELLDQLNGRYLRSDLAENLIKQNEERYVELRKSIEDLYRLLEGGRGS